MLSVPTCLPSTCGFELNVAMAQPRGRRELADLDRAVARRATGRCRRGGLRRDDRGRHRRVGARAVGVLRGHTHTKGVTDVRAAQVVQAPVGAADPGAATAVLVAALILVRVARSGCRSTGRGRRSASEPACGVPLIVGGVVLLGAALDAARPRPAVPKTAPMTTAETAMSSAVAARANGFLDWCMWVTP